MSKNTKILLTLFAASLAASVITNLVTARARQELEG